MTWLPKLTRTFLDMARNASVAKRDETVKRMNERLNEALADAPVIPEREVSLEKPAQTSNSIPSGKFDASAFFSSVRGSLFSGTMRQGQADGCNAILKAMDGTPISWCAYALATAFHETAYTMQPIKEHGGHSYFMRMYDITGQRPHVARELGNTQEGDGAKYAGRGYVQLTGRRNYAKAQQKTGASLLQNPDLAMQPDIAARIMREGMIDGWFTGRGFVHFLPSVGAATRAAFREARRIINGTDKRDKIADEALKFQDALIAGGWE
jgi:predicted chitinase